jgi:hypothetical protein
MQRKNWVVEAEAKIVPKDDWYKSPASKPAEGDKKG